MISGKNPNSEKEKATNRKKNVKTKSRSKTKKYRPRKSKSKKIYVVTSGAGPLELVENPSRPDDVCGYDVSENGLFIPQDMFKPVPLSKIQKGFEQAKKDIIKFVNNLQLLMSGNSSIKEIELTASFNAEGKFLGFGVGGAVSITIKLAPNKS